MIKDLVKGESANYSRHNPEKRFLFDIVANKRNSFDLDKLDYLNRDLKHTRINEAHINYKRIIKHASIIDNKIAYNRKIYNDINLVFNRRFELFKQVYLHKTCMAIEFMVAEALVKANPVYRFDEIISKPEEYIRLMHDDLLHVIKKSRKPELQDSANILRRIDQRDLFKCAGESIIHKDWKRLITKEDIIGYQDMNLAVNGQGLRPEDLKVHIFKVDWGNDESYPLDNMHFFTLNSNSQPVACELPRYGTTQYRPKQNFEYRVRVFVKDSTKEALAKSAFARYSKKNGGLRNLP